MVNGQQVHDLTSKVICMFVCLAFFSLSVGTAPLTLSSLLALAIWLFSGRCYKDRADWLSQEWLLPVCALCVLPWVAMLWSSAPIDQALKFATRSHYWLFAFMAASVMKSERTVQNVMICFISGASIIAVMLCLYFNGIIPVTTYLLNFSARSYITYSLFIVVSVLVLAFMFKSSPSIYTKSTLAILMLFLVIMITQLKGRSAYLSLALLSPWLFVTMFGRRRLFPIVAAVIITLAFMFSSEKVQERMALIPKEIKLYQSGVSSHYTINDGTQIPSSVGLRLMMWNDALKIVQRYPLFGAGTGAYQHEVKKSNPENVLSHPHNSFLYIIANYGMFGIGLYGWLFVVTLKRAWRARDHLAGHTVLAFLFVILIGSLTDTQVLSVATGIVLGFIAGLPMPSTQCAS